MYKKTLRKIGFSALSGFILLSILLFTQGAFAASIRMAPLNPKFLEYNRQITLGSAGSAVLSTGKTKHPSGYRPSPLDLSHVRAPAHLLSSAKGGSPLPGRFDLREKEGVSPVRDQAPYGTCWAFCALASLESTFKMREKGDLDLSEWHLGYFGYVDEQRTGFPGFYQMPLEDGKDPVFDQGGNGWTAAAVLGRWTGAVKEKDRPYKGPLPLSSDPVFKHLENVLFLGEDFEGEAVKRALTTYGAVSVSMMWDDDFFNEVHNSYYRRESADDGGHCVTIIGWDDDFARENFPLPNPPEKGAWLVRNSWGAEWAESGCFWLSYSDPSIQNGAVFIGGDGDKYDRNYQYDPLGWTNYMLYDERAILPDQGDETAWCANIFTARGPAEGYGEELLKAFSVYAGAGETSYRAEIRTGVDAGDPRGGVLALEKEGILSAAGYHTIEISPVALKRGERFSVVLKLSTPGYLSPIPVEYPVPEYSDKAKASAGESFVSPDGEDWTDLTEEYPNTNVCIKAFSSDTPSSSGGGCSALPLTPFALGLLAPLFLLRRR